MSSALLYFCFMVSVARPTAVVLSVCIGVGGWGWPISMSVCLIGRPNFAFINNETYSASAADVTTVCIMFVVFRIAPFGVYFLAGFEPR